MRETGELEASLLKKPKTERAKAVGTLLAQRAHAAGIVRVVFDRGGNRYHGRVSAAADGAREGAWNFNYTYGRPETKTAAAGSSIRRTRI